MMHSGLFRYFAEKAMSPDKTPESAALEAMLAGKSEHTLDLFRHFVGEFRKIGEIRVLPAKTMIGIANMEKRVVYVTQLGKNFMHVVFPFKKPYPDNLCFQKIAQVPGDQQFNHHFRMHFTDDVNEEVLSFMEMAFKGEER